MHFIVRTCIVYKYKSTNYLWICQSKNFPAIPFYCFVSWYIKSNFISLDLYQLPLTIFYVALAAQVVTCNILYTTIIVLHK